MPQASSLKRSACTERKRDGRCRATTRLSTNSSQSAQPADPYRGVCLMATPPAATMALAPHAKFYSRQGGGDLPAKFGRSRGIRGRGRCAVVLGRSVGLVVGLGLCSAPARTMLHPLVLSPLLGQQPARTRLEHCLLRSLNCIADVGHGGAVYKREGIGGAKDGYFNDSSTRRISHAPARQCAVAELQKLGAQAR